MDKARALLMLGVAAAAAVCLASANATINPDQDTYATKQNGVDGSVDRDQVTAQPVHNYLYNHGGNVALQNSAGSIFKRPDGRTVLIGAGGQTLVTDAEDTDKDLSEEDISRPEHNNVIINSHTVMNVGYGGYQSYNNHRIHIVDGGLQLTTGGNVYNFPAKGAGVNSKETVIINGKEATVEYENGNIVVELADGTVLAKADGGLFSGNRNSYVNRKQIQENAAREAARITEDVARFQKDLQDNLNKQMKQLQDNLRFEFGNIFS